jgi:aminoglycoside/choline kinase family phosphotransferase
MAETNGKDEGLQAAGAEPSKVMTFDIEEGLLLLPTLGRQSGVTRVSQGSLEVRTRAINNEPLFRTYKRRWIGLIAIVSDDVNKSDI